MAVQTTPSYLELYERGILYERLQEARKRLENCMLCPRVCRANRLKDEIGLCKVGHWALVSSFGPHFGEERVLRSTWGSGTVFFAGCNSRCVYCQNYPISQLLDGYAVTAERLAEIFLSVQRMGCHNLNLVTPSHVVAQILEALELAIPEGFRLPLVYNTSGYDSVAALRLLDGIVGIYMPDLKYNDSQMAEKYSGIKHYWEVAWAAFKEMHRQVGDLVVKDGLAVHGLLIRHLVPPNGLSGSKEVLQFITKELSRQITLQEYEEVVESARSLGLHHGIPLEYAD